MIAGHTMYCPVQYYFIAFYYFLKWANPGLFSIYFRSFQTNFTTFTTNKCEKYPSNIWRRESNPRLLERQSLPITTRPGLPPNYFLLFGSKKLKMCDSIFIHILRGNDFGGWFGNLKTCHAFNSLRA